MFKKLSVIFLMISSVGFCYDANIFTGRSSEVELFPVTIGGAVIQTGTYYVPPALHIIDIIKLAAGGILPNLRTFDCRSIEIRSGNKITKIDLLRYLSDNSIKNNPYINSGMNIRIGYAVHFAWVQGDIQGAITGKIPIRQGETIGDLISLFTLNTTADSSRILLRRISGEMKEYSISDLSSISVEDRDFISVLPKENTPQLSSVSISGEAARPGVYPIVHGKTSIASIISIAGGASAQGDLTRAFIIRKAKLQKQQVNSIENGQNNVRPEVTGGFKYLAASNDYAIISTSNDSIPLEDGDEIFVPKVENCIYVSGCVGKPGAYEFSKGMNSRQFITLAGGFTPTADKHNVKVITSYTNDAYKIKMPGDIAAGDIIMVPEAQEDKWLKRWSPIIQIVASVVSTTSIVIGLMRLQN